MRVSDSMMNEVVTSGVQHSQQRLYDAQRAASSGARVEKPSDDPVAASLARAHTSRAERSDKVARMSGEAVDRMVSVDGALASVGDVLSRVRELAVQGANGTLSANDRAGMATEVHSLRQQLLSLASTQIDGEYVFSGLATDTAPFDAAGNYQGSTAVREIEVGPGVRIATQLSGADVFGASAGVNVFASLDSLAAAFEQNDAASVSALIKDFTTAGDQVADARAAAGAMQSMLQQSQALAEATRDQSTARRADLTEVDPVDAFTQLVKAENALRAAISVASRMPPPSLVEG